MNIRESVLKYEEKAVFELRSLYRRYGFLPYKMSKFEEYDLYVRNKDFLVSDHIITFTDTDGKLMALKPDVTLSIIKNGKDAEGFVQKLCYNENVYRVTKGAQSFKEIMQVGLECIGDIDEYNIYEVIMLAAEILSKISDEYVLDISHLGILDAVMDNINIPQDIKPALLKCIGEKNIHELTSILLQEGIDPEPIKKLVALYGEPSKVLCELKKLDYISSDAVCELERIVSLLENAGYGKNIRIDFSVVNDLNYYNGFVFKGFIKNVATGVLSGGQYDKLMKKLGRSSGAVGFAVYLDMLERLNDSESEYDVDALLIYGDEAELSALANAVKLLSDNGKSVMVQKNIPSGIRYKQLLMLKERGVEIVENNA
jgi:ATP phosphoribosyltransferase regulatory subunit